MHGQTSKPVFIRAILFSTVGTVFVSFCIYSILHGSFRYGRFGHSAVMTPDSHPFFFWSFLLFMLVLGGGALWLGIADIRFMLRRRARQLRQPPNDKSGNA
jgi:hypothetical protein